MKPGSRGLTLVEICITVAIIALGAAIVIPAIGNVSRADLRRASSALASKIRESFDNAALSGQSYRMVFVLGAPEKAASAVQVIDAHEGMREKARKPGIYIESTEATLTFDTKAGAFVAAAEASEILEALDPHPGDDDKKDKAKHDDSEGADTHKNNALTALMGINKLGTQANKAGFKEQSVVPLGDGVHVLDVWTEGMDQATAEGDVYLLFFPNGYTQDAMIHLEDSERRVMTVRVAPLTGKCSILPGYTEVPK